MKSNSIGIIGMGWVGSSVAISILNSGICKELLVNDVNEAVAEGEAMDLNHGSSFYPTAEVKACSIKEMIHCSAIVVTAGRGGKPTESRLSLLKDNVTIAKSISGQLKGFNGILIVVSNPVDVLTYFFQKFTGLPAGRVIGTGTMLDTARLREMIGRKIDVDPKNIHANVIGEHGDSEVTVWSRAMIGNIPLRTWKGWDLEVEPIISEQVRTSAYEIIKRKGSTNHAIGLVTATLLKWILRGDKRIVSVSTVLKSISGYENVAISLPSLISENGVEEVIYPELSEEENRLFENSLSVINKAIKEVEY